MRILAVQRPRRQHSKGWPVVSRAHHHCIKRKDHHHRRTGPRGFSPRALADYFFRSARSASGHTHTHTHTRSASSKRRVAASQRVPILVRLLLVLCTVLNVEGGSITQTQLSSLSYSGGRYICYNCSLTLRRELCWSLAFSVPLLLHRRCYHLTLTMCPPRTCASGSNDSSILSRSSRQMGSHETYI